MKHFIAAIALAFLNEPAILKMLDSDSRLNVQEKNYKFVESPYYIKKDITGLAGEVELITSATIEKHGTVNFDKGKLPELENLILEGLTIGQYKGTATDPGAVKYSTVADTNLDPALANASIIIRQDNLELVNLPVARFMQAVASDRARINEGWNFDNYRLIKANRLFSVNLKFPEGVAVADDSTNKIMVSVDLNGQVTKLK